MNPFTIMKLVEKTYGLPAGSICSAKRGKSRSEARAVAVHLCRMFTRMSFPELAEMFLKDHSSLCSAAQTIRNTSIVEIKNIVEDLTTLIQHKYIEVRA